MGNIKIHQRMLNTTEPVEITSGVKGWPSARDDECKINVYPLVALQMEEQISIVMAIGIIDLRSINEVSVKSEKTVRGKI